MKIKINSKNILKKKIIGTKINSFENYIHSNKYKLQNIIKVNNKQ